MQQTCLIKQNKLLFNKNKILTDIKYNKFVIIAVIIAVFICSLTRSNSRGLQSADTKDSHQEHYMFNDSMTTSLTNR